MRECPVAATLSTSNTHPHRPTIPTPFAVN